MIGITSWGAYVPRLRLQRKSVAAANAWFAPGLARAKGERAMANWDEDALTMAVEAGRDCVPTEDPLSGRARLDALYFASTSMPFADRQNAGIAARALGLGESLSALDITGTQRAGTSALLAALDAVAAGRAHAPLVLASDKRKTRVASSQELAYGDGAGALALGRDTVLARFLAGHSRSVDFVDHFRGAGEAFDYGWEERWIRDEGYTKIVPAAIQTLLASAGVAGRDVAHIIIPTPFARLDAGLAKQCGLDPERLVEDFADRIGNAGNAQPLLMLVAALERARPGDKILVAQFGNGCDVLLFEATPALADAHRGRLAATLARRKEETNYMKYLAFNGLIDLEKGMRAEVDRKTALTVLHRKSDMLTSLVGGRCQRCGTAQFPRSRICVNPNCQAVDSQEPYSFAERRGTVLSWSADFLTYSMSPPNHYGMITFAEGGRFMADITDVEEGQIDSGAQVRMVFRIKEFDAKRGFVRYFWKAVPI